MTQDPKARRIRDWMLHELSDNWQKYVDNEGLDLTALAEEAFRVLQDKLQIPLVRWDIDELPDVYFEMAEDAAQEFFIDPNCPMT